MSSVILICTLASSLAWMNLFAAVPAWRQCTNSKLHERDVRRFAVKTVLPPYPEEAKKARAQGVAVAELEITTKGDVTSVRLLESPHPSIEEAVSNAVMQWKFKVDVPADAPQCVKGKLTFYFVIEGNNARVKNPQRYS